MTDPTANSEMKASPDIGGMQAALTGEGAPEIVALEADLRIAQLGSDVDALATLISDDLLFTGPDGQLASKAQDLEAHGSGFIRFRIHEPEELRIRRVRANVAVTSLRARLAVELAGSLVEGTYRYTRVWARESDNHWRVVAGHVSAVQQSDESRAKA